MTDTFRALCEELAAEWADAMRRLRAALAQPEPQELNHEDASRHTVESCLSQREEVLAAFIAKHGFCPDEAIQIEQRQEDGSATWRIERRAELVEPEAEEPTIPSRYGGHEIDVYRDGFHAGYKEALARAALAEQLVGPTDEELLKLTENVSTEHLYAHRGLPSDWDPGDYCSSPRGLIEFARAVLARWGTPAIEPVAPTDEELWEAWGCFEHEPFSKGDTIMQLREFLARWGQT
jgi:hypothetical protein